MTDFHLIDSTVQQSGYRILGQERLPGRPAKFLPIPLGLHANVRNLIAQSIPDGLYGHQAEAIDAGLEGSDICLATSTASGKSLVYNALASDTTLRDDHSRVIAFYPARALIQDQLEKWEAALKPLGLNFGFIDGGLPVPKRVAVLERSRVVLMTPDVAHAWMMSNLKTPEIKSFLHHTKILILDEAHTYEGVLGTNMAFFLRRLLAVSNPQKIITSTATLDNPSDFVYQLTGRRPRTFGPDADCSATPSKTIALLQGPADGSFENMVALLRNLAVSYAGRFVAFADSRRMVEQMVMALKRSVDRENRDDIKSDPGDGTEQTDTKTKPVDLNKAASILPYRAGYETEDRNAIQRALAQGNLTGVVATSALELGIDIGEIDLIVLLNQPPTLKAFWQRCGRAGRKRPAVCLLIDNRGTLANTPLGLQNYLAASLESSWLYLQNRYLQYTNALCAALEYRDHGQDQYTAEPFESLPGKFNKFLDSELKSPSPVAPDLYPLKQRAQAGPHREFPIRTGIEKNFRVKQRHGKSLGKLTFSQLLREAYPGAVYYYMGRPYRVKRYQYRRGEILVDKEKYWTTRPQTMTKVFPGFKDGLLKLFSSDDGFVAESEVTIGERVTGFVEQRGPAKIEHVYQPASPFYQRELQRYFDTTGVCWWFPVAHLNSAPITQRILEAFCTRFGVQKRDLGVGTFHSNSPPAGPQKCRGMCIFDATQGSLRLTERLADFFGEILERAILLARLQNDTPALQGLKEIAGLTMDLQPQNLEGIGQMERDGQQNQSAIIAAGATAVHESTQGPMQVVVLEHRHTSHGLMYEIKPSVEKAKYDPGSRPAHREHSTKRKPPKTGMKWLVAANTVQPIPGETKMIPVNQLPSVS